MIARERADTKTDKLEMRKLPASEYKQKCDLAIEVLHLWTDHDLRQRNRYYEVWIPVEQK